MTTYSVRNNARSSDMTERIYYLIGHKFSQFQALSGYFENKKVKVIKDYLRYKTVTSQNVSSEAKIKSFFIS